MCTKFTICGKKHLPKWRRSKTKRNYKGQYSRDYSHPYLKAFFVSSILSMLGVFFFVGVNNVWNYIKSFERTIIVENVLAVEDPLDKLNPALYKVCACESDVKYKTTPQHYDESGNVLVGVSGDIGYCQINPFVHTENSEAMGINFYTPKGNIAYANYLYNLNGFRDWKASKHCWK